MVKIKKRRDFIATNSRTYKERCDNYVVALPKHKTELGLTDEQVAKATTMAENVSALLQQKFDTEHQFKTLCKKVEEEMSDFTHFLRIQRNDFKELDAFTDAIGKDLGFDVSMVDVDTDNLQPELKITMDGIYPALTFNKQGTDGVKIYSRRNNEHFRLLDYTTSTRYIDITSKADEEKKEFREYYALFVYKDKIVGKKSEVYGIMV